MKQDLKFYLTVVFTKDEKSGDVTACYAQFPEASAQGRTEQEAEDLLDEIFPYLLADKKEEFIKYHNTSFGQMTYLDREISIK